MEKYTELREAYLNYQEARKAYKREQDLFLQVKPETEDALAKAKYNLNGELYHQGWATF